MSTMQEYGAAVREAAAKLVNDTIDLPLDQIPGATARTFDYELGVRRGLIVATNAIRAMPLPEPPAPAAAQADELADLRARLAAAEAAAKERGEALRVYAMDPNDIADNDEWINLTWRIDEWVADGMRPSDLPELPEWARESQPKGTTNGN